MEIDEKQEQMVDFSSIENYKLKLLKIDSFQAHQTVDFN